MARRNWCFTINDPASIDAFAIPEDAHGTIRYCVWQHEKVERLHIQGYVELTKPQRLVAVKRLLKCDTVHLEERRGTREQARAYCMKAESRVDGPWEFGEWTGGGQGKRNDLADACKVMMEGGLDALIDAHPTSYVKYSRGLKELLFHQEQKKAKTNRTLSVIVLWGPTGSGKTRTAMEIARTGNSWFKLDMAANGTNLWWDGYSGESTLIMDDFYGWIPHGKLLNLLDIYPLRLDVKGSHTWACWTTVIITSNKPPEEWYEKNWEPLERRIHHTIHVDGTQEPEELLQYVNEVINEI
nr:MAG: replication associated protein [Cressdnaviricota sp.]